MSNLKMIPSAGYKPAHTRLILWSYTIVSCRHLVLEKLIYRLIIYDYQVILKILHIMILGIKILSMGWIRTRVTGSWSTDYAACTITAMKFVIPYPPKESSLKMIPRAGFEPACSL